MAQPKTNEMNPTGELREWSFVSAKKDKVNGRVYSNAYLDDGVTIQVINIIEARDYRDHYFFITSGGEHWLAYKLNMYLNGGPH